MREYNIHPTDRYEQKQEEAQTTPPRLLRPPAVVRERARAVFACTAKLFQESEGKNRFGE